MLRILTKLLVALSVTAIAMCAADKEIGTWKLNAAKTKSNTRNPLISRTVVIEAMDGGVRETRTDQRADGTALNYTFTYKYDGKEYPVSGAQFDTVSLKRVDAYTTTEEVKKAGTPYHITGRWIVSKDGKTWTQIEQGIAADGKPVQTTRIYEKQ